LNVVRRVLTAVLLKFSYSRRIGAHFSRSNKKDAGKRI